MNFTESELKIIKECVKEHPKGYKILYSENQYQIIKECVKTHPNSKSIIEKIEELQHV